MRSLRRAVGLQGLRCSRTRVLRLLESSVQARCLARLGPVSGGGLASRLPIRVGCRSLWVRNPKGTVTRRGSKGDCPARAGTAHLAVPIGTRTKRETAMREVIIGVDPHKLSATIEVVDRYEKVLGSGRLSTDPAGCTSIRTYAETWPERV